MKYEIDETVVRTVVNTLCQSHLINTTYVQVNTIISQLQRLKPIEEKPLIEDTIRSNEGEQRGEENND